MADAVWTLDASDGELLVRTGVGGRAAKMGHRLTIAMKRWTATVRWSGDEPVSTELVVDVNSLDVLHGEGGVKGLSGAEKTLVRSNALRSLDASRFTEIRFTADTIDKTGDGYRLRGTLQINRKTQDCEIYVHTDDLGDAWRMSGQATVRQTDFGVKPYSLLMGSVKVADEVTVAFSAQHTKE